MSQKTRSAYTFSYLHFPVKHSPPRNRIARAAPFRIPNAPAGGAESLRALDMVGLPLFEQYLQRARKVATATAITATHKTTGPLNLKSNIAARGCQASIRNASR